MSLKTFICLAALLAPLPAAAHAVLLASQPPVGGSVPAGQIDFRLRYNSRIDLPRSRLTLTRPDHSQSTLRITPADGPDQMRAAAILAPGAYVLRWQVLAIDGHITRGDIPFSVSR